MSWYMSGGQVVVAPGGGIFDDGGGAPPPPASFDFYISTTGSDSSPGTLASPWAITSLKDNSSHQSLLAQKRIGLLPGTYNISALSSGNNSGNYQCPILNIPAGTALIPTYIASCDALGNYAQGTATIFNNSGSQINSIIGQNSFGNGRFTIDGIVFDLGGNIVTPTAGFIGSCCTFYNLSDTITVQNCEYKNLFTTSASGNNIAFIFIDTNTSYLIQNNYFHDLYRTNQTIHTHCIEEYRCQNGRVLYNTFYNVSSAIDSKIGNAGIEFAYNYLYKMLDAVPCGLQGFDGNSGDPNPPGTASKIHHNCLDSLNAFTWSTDVNSFRQQPFLFYNNTVYESRSGSVVTNDFRTASGGTGTVYNNIMVAPSVTGGGSNGGTAITTGGITLMDYNCYDRNSLTSAWGRDSGGTLYNSLATWQASAGSFDAHSTTSDPLFVGPYVAGSGAAQYKLNQSTSPVRAGGATPGRIGGVIGGTAIDMGCWGYDPTLGAAPTQIGANLSLANGQSFTITGIGFGTKSRAIAPLAYDTITTAVGTVSGQWNVGTLGGTGYQPTAAGGIYNFQAQAVGFSPTGATIGGPDPFAVNIYAGCHRFLNNSTAGNAVAFDHTYTPVTYPAGMYARYMLRFDPNWIPDPLSDNNMKFMMISDNGNWQVGSALCAFTARDLNCFPISSISQASPCTVSLYQNGLGVNPATIGEIVTFDEVQGMTQINGLTGTVTSLGGSDPFWHAIVNIDTTGFTAFKSFTVTGVARGGTADAGAPASGYTLITVNDSGVTNPFIGYTFLNLQSIGGTTTLNAIGPGANNSSIPSNLGFITATAGVQGAWTATIDVNTSAAGAYTTGGTATTGRFCNPYTSATVQTQATLDIAGGIFQNPDANGHNSANQSNFPWPMDPSNGINGWNEVEQVMGVTNVTGLAGQGFYSEYWNRTHSINYFGKTSTIAASSAHNFQMGQYARDRSVNNFRYYGGPIVFDVSNGSANVARLMAGDQPTLAACTFLEYVYPTAWSDTAVTGNFYKGRFTSGQTAYFYVYTEAGTQIPAGSRTVA